MVERIDARQTRTLSLETASRVERLPEHGVRPALAAALVGEDPASMVYVSRTIAECGRIGIRSVEHRLAGDIGEERLPGHIDEPNSDDTIQGVPVQLPWPADIDRAHVINRIIDPDDTRGRRPLIISVEVTIEAGEEPTRVDQTADYRRAIEAPATHVPLIETFGDHSSRTFLGRVNVAAVSGMIDKPFALAGGMAGIDVSVRRQLKRVSSSTKSFDLDASEERCACRGQGAGFAEARS